MVSRSTHLAKTTQESQCCGIQNNQPVYGHIKSINTMDFRKAEKLLTCPYNPSHQILPHRMAQHLVKCKKSYPDADMKVCVFNATHVVPTHLYQVHILECPDKAIVERDIYRRREVENKLQAKRQTSRPVISTHAVCTDEDWDSETVASSYNPTENIIHREIARAPPPGLGKAGRRKWREVELERLRRLKAGEPIDDLVYPGKQEDQMIGSQMKSASVDVISQCQSFSRITSSTSSLIVQSDQPLRRPKFDLEPQSRIAANIFHNGSCTTVNSMCQADSPRERKGRGRGIILAADMAKFLMPGSEN